MQPTKGCFSGRTETATAADYNAKNGYHGGFALAVRKNERESGDVAERGLAGWAGKKCQSNRMPTLGSPACITERIIGDLTAKTVHDLGFPSLTARSE
jgi:hypothetical protein